MKKVFKTVFLFMLIACSVIKANSMTFEEAFAKSDSTPMVVLVYAQWADNYQNYIQQFRTAKEQLSDNYNFVEMDIASKDTKFFNSRYHIYPNVPYILMYRNSGKVSRYIDRNCAASSSCIVPKLKSFIQW